MNALKKAHYPPQNQAGQDPQGRIPVCALTEHETSDYDKRHERQWQTFPQFHFYSPLID